MVNTDMDTRTKWGIVSAGLIAHDFVKALSTLSPEDHVVVAVAARSLAAAKNFAEKHGIARAYGSYGELFEDPDVKVVYIGTVHPSHLSVCIKAIEKGKNVLCEKPMAMNVDETVKIISKAKLADVFLMEAIWTRCHPAYLFLEEKLKNGAIGEPIRVDVSFGKGPLHNFNTKEKGGSVVLLLGIYCVQLSTFIFNISAKEMVKPVQILSTGLRNESGPDGFDIATSTILEFPENKYATLQMDERATLTNCAVITGTNGIARVLNPFHAPTHVEINGEVFDFSPADKTLLGGDWNYQNSYYLRFEAEEVRRCLLEGLKESPKMTLMETVLIAEIMEEIRRSAGVKVHTE